MAKIVKKGRSARMAAKKPARSKSEAKRHAALDDTAPKGTPPDVNPVPTAEGSASDRQIHDADDNGVKMPRGSQKPGKPALMSEKPDERLAQLEKCAIQHGWAITLPGEPLAEPGE